jgi:hypothetical protein
VNRPLTDSDLHELERLLGESGAGNPEDVRTAAQNAQGLGPDGLFKGAELDDLIEALDAVRASAMAA